MRRLLVLLMMGLCLSACQALAATPAPIAVKLPAAAAPRATWPPTWTPTSTPTAAPTRTSAAIAAIVRSTATPTAIEFEHRNWAAAIRPTATNRATPGARATLVITTNVAVTHSVELRVFAVGDSVMLGAARELRKTIAGIEVDAQVSRHVGATLAILQQRQAAGRLGRIVIMQIGNNGYLTARQFDDLMRPLTSLTRVVIVNLKEPRKWEAPNNQVLADGVARYPNTVLVDWHTYGMDHPELFAKDGIHIGAAGAQAYTALIAAQLTGLLDDPIVRPTDLP